MTSSFVYDAAHVDEAADGGTQSDALHPTPPAYTHTPYQPPATTNTCSSTCSTVRAMQEPRVEERDCRCDEHLANNAAQ